MNQAPITGKSMLIEKARDSGFAGTIDGLGSLEVRTTKGFADPTIAKIIHLVEESPARW